MTSLQNAGLGEQDHFFDPHGLLTLPHYTSCWDMSGNVFTFHCHQEHRTEGMNSQSHIISECGYAMQAELSGSLNTCWMFGALLGVYM